MPDISDFVSYGRQKYPKIRPPFFMNGLVHNCEKVDQCMSEVLKMGQNYLEIGSGNGWVMEFLKIYNKEIMSIEKKVGGYYHSDEELKATKILPSDFICTLESVEKVFVDIYKGEKIANNKKLDLSDVTLLMFMPPNGVAGFAHYLQVFKNLGGKKSVIIVDSAGHPQGQTAMLPNDIWISTIQSMSEQHGGFAVDIGVEPGQWHCIFIGAPEAVRQQLEFFQLSVIPFNGYAKMLMLFLSQDYALNLKFSIVCVLSLAAVLKSNNEFNTTAIVKVTVLSEIVSIIAVYIAYLCVTNHLLQCFFVGVIFLLSSFLLPVLNEASPGFSQLNLDKIYGFREDLIHEYCKGKGITREKYNEFPNNHVDISVSQRLT